MSKGAKIAVWIGVLATVGVSGYIGYQVYKKWKDKKNGTTSTDQTSGDKNVITTVLDKITPTPSNFETLKTNISNYKNMGNYITYETTPSNLGISGSSIGLSNNQKIIVKFTASGWFGLFLSEIKASNKIVEGKYTNGGKNLEVTLGKNKGLLVSGESVSDNIKKTLA